MRSPLMWHQNQVCHFYKGWSWAQPGSYIFPSSSHYLVSSYNVIISHGYNTLLYTIQFMGHDHLCIQGVGDHMENPEHAQITNSCSNNIWLFQKYSADPCLNLNVTYFPFKKVQVYTVAFHKNTFHLTFHVIYVSVFSISMIICKIIHTMLHFLIITIKVV